VITLISGFKSQTVGLTLERLSGSLYQLLYGVTGQIPSSVFGFAVRASVQTAVGERGDHKHQEALNTHKYDG